MLNGEQATIDVTHRLIYHYCTIPAHHVSLSRDGEAPAKDNVLLSFHSFFSLHEPLRKKIFHRVLLVRHLVGSLPVPETLSSLEFAFLARTSINHN